MTTERRSRAGRTTCIAIVSMALGGALVGCSDLFCPEPELLPIEDGSYRGRSEGVRPRIRDAAATIEGDELTIEYVQDTDGRTYVVRLRERE